MGGRSDVQRLRDFLADAPDELSPGDQVGNVRLKAALKEGGMGSVWLAEHLTLRTDVAVKFISERLAHDAESRERFSREATAAAQIDSAHVVRILDHGLIDGDRPYIVMECLRGEDLESRLDRETVLPLADITLVVEHVARALSGAHALGIVHRDIKPGNIFLSVQDGSPMVKLLDFGIAKRSEPGVSASTRTGALVGTPHYMSPEHVRSPKGVDHRTDLWSLAVVAYECLTGRHPFDGETVGAVSIAIDRAELEPPTRLRPDLPSSLDAWFAQALARDPARRFGSARDLAMSFSRAAAGQDHVEHAIDEPSAAPETDRTAPSDRSGIEEEREVIEPEARRPAFRPATIAVALGIAALVLGPALAWRMRDARNPTSATAPEPSVDTRPPEPPKTDGPGSRDPGTTAPNADDPRASETPAGRSPPDQAIAERTPSRPPAPTARRRAGSPAEPPPLAPLATAEPKPADPPTATVNPFTGRF